MTIKRFTALLLAACGLASTASQAYGQSNDWTPLDPAQFVSELVKPWIMVPDGSSGAPRQGWLNTADGFFTREVHLAYDTTQIDGAPNADQALARFHYPLTRRLWAGVEVPFIRSVGDNSEFGDITLTTQVMLAETRNLSINAGAGVQLPTGDRAVGGDVFGVTPQVNLWADIGSGIAVRGRVAYAFRNHNGVDGFIANLALGQTITPKEATPFGQFTYYLSANLFEPDTGATFFSLTPGVRTRLAGNLFLLAGVEIPIVNSRDYFDHRIIGQFVYGF